MMKSIIEKHIEYIEGIIKEVSSNYYQHIEEAGDDYHTFSEQELELIITTLHSLIGGSIEGLTNEVIQAGHGYSFFLQNRG